MSLSDFIRRKAKADEELTVLNELKDYHAQRVATITEEINQATQKRQKLCDIEQSLVIFLREKHGDLPTEDEEEEDDTVDIEDEAVTEHGNKESIPYGQLVHPFITKNINAIRQVFLTQHPRRKDILQCPATTNGIHALPSSLKFQHNIPKGVHGTKPRMGKQNFVICYKRTYLNAKLLGVDVDLTNFEDPRDCAAVIHRIDELFMAWSKAKFA